MTPKRKQRRTPSNKPLMRLKRQRAQAESAHATPPARAQHPTGCLAMHHQSGIDFDRDCPVCMDELDNAVIGRRRNG